jgi:uncharacterized membrane protein
VWSAVRTPKFREKNTTFFFKAEDGMEAAGASETSVATYQTINDATSHTTAVRISNRTPSRYSVQNKRLKELFLLLWLLLFVFVTFIRGIYNNIPQTNGVSSVYNVFAILCSNLWHM